MKPIKCLLGMHSYSQASAEVKVVDERNGYLICRVMERPHIDSMTNQRIDEALSMAIEALQDKLEIEERQSNW